MLQLRERKIIQVLLKNNGRTTTTNELALQLSVSSKTIKNDIKRINSAFEEKNYRILTKKGQGIWLDFSQKDVNELHLISSFGGNLEDSNRMRKLDIIFLLLDEKDYISVETIANKCYASASTILRDLDELEEFFTKHNLMVIKEPRQGVKLIGEEISFRIAHAEAIKRETSLDHYLDDFVKFQNNFPELPIVRIKELVETFKNDQGLDFSDVALKGLILHIAISLQRLREEKFVEMNAEELHHLGQRPEWQLGKVLAKELETVFQQDMGESEIGYLTIHLMGANLSNNYQHVQQPIKTSDVDPELLTHLEIWTKSVDSSFRTKLLQDRQFILGMLLHIKPLLNRLKYGITIDNPWVEEIKRNYPKTYEIAVKYSQLIRQDFDLNLNEDEISYLAMHIGPAIDKTEDYPKEKVTAIVVCASGMGTSHFLKHKLESEFTQLEIMGIYSSFDKQIKETKADLIISTVPLTQKDNRIIYVSPVLSTEEKNSLQSLLIVNKQESQLRRLLAPSLVILGSQAQTVEEVITIGGDLLVAQNYVTPEFISSTLQREKLSATAIGNLIAIPHSYSGHVLKQGIAVIQLVHGIDWGKEKVQLIFLLAIDSQSQHLFMDIFEELADFTSNLQRVNKVLNINDKNELLEEITRN